MQKGFYWIFLLIFLEDKKRPDSVESGLMFVNCRRSRLIN